MAKEYFNAYHSYLEAMEHLNDAERGRLFTACLIYSTTGEASELRGNERFVFPSMKSQIDRDSGNYSKRCKKNRENANKRWKDDDAMACDGMRMDANGCETCQGEGEGEGEGEGKGEGKGEGRRDNSDASRQPSTPYQDICDAYNRICKSFSRCKTLSEARKKAIKARMNAGYTVDQLELAFTKAEASSFLKGKNDRNWTASFDWLLKDANLAKVLDGNYDDKLTAKQYDYDAGGESL